MSVNDTRPRWLLRKQARISARRLDRFGRRPDLLSVEGWWLQVVEAAADLGLDPGSESDWQAWNASEPP